MARDAVRFARLCHVLRTLAQRSAASTAPEARRVQPLGAIQHDALLGQERLSAAAAALRKVVGPACAAVRQVVLDVHAHRRATRPFGERTRARRAHEAMRVIAVRLRPERDDR